MTRCALISRPTVSFLKLIALPYRLFPIPSTRGSKRTVRTPNRYVNDIRRSPPALRPQPGRSAFRRRQVLASSGHSIVRPRPTCLRPSRREGCERRRTLPPRWACVVGGRLLRGRLLTCAAWLCSGSLPPATGFLGWLLLSVLGLQSTARFCCDRAAVHLAASQAACGRGSGRGPLARSELIGRACRLRSG